jgi:hypothetical protein
MDFTLLFFFFPPQGLRPFTDFNGFTTALLVKQLFVKWILETTVQAVSTRNSGVINEIFLWTQKITLGSSEAQGYQSKINQIPTIFFL